ncbi:hypothetical protein MIND_00989300 [Mycena indigotica]|uniref:Uncharacterized protein n=1 Tax=Mycena indigotica TaxID=2126181 RepID=A0A8H6VY58_9AGAR|nr:uncharacterized protein MIND_00989300 [Mycena indigotica]KAF7294528.1 hypothetical protein MIND_00989300 [Mycena indigotica]
MLASLFSLFRSQEPTLPPTGVRIVPCTGIDVAVVDAVLTTVFVVDARLDPKKLEDSISLLIVEKFPRGGARLAFRNGQYEYQIPNTFDAATPPVSFTSNDFSELYDSCGRPSLANLRKSDMSTPFICSVPELGPFTVAPACPKTLKDFLEPNTPLINIHVTTFDDLTFIGLTSSHVTFDVMGTKTLLHAWTRLLSGETLESIPGMAWDAAPFSAFNEGPSPSNWIQRGFFDLGLVSKLVFIAQFILRVYRDPKLVGMTVCVPKVFLESEKQKIMAELKAADSTEWVGSSDVLLAWWFKASYSHRTDNTALHIHLPSNLRERPIFSTSSGKLDTAYMNNAVMGIPIAPFTISAFRATPLREIALQFRHAILAYTADVDGLKRDVQWRCANPTAMAFPCPAGAEYSMQTNWRSAKFAELDFSGALVDVKPDRKARVVLVNAAVKSNKMRDGGVVLFETDEAVWMGQLKGEQDWQSATAVFLASTHIDPMRVLIRTSTRLLLRSRTAGAIRPASHSTHEPPEDYFRKMKRGKLIQILKGTTADFNTKLAAIEAKFDEKLTKLAAENADLKQEITNLKQEIANLKQDNINFKGQVADLTLTLLRMLEEMVSPIAQKAALNQLPFVRAIQASIASLSSTSNTTTPVSSPDVLDDLLFAIDQYYGNRTPVAAALKSDFIQTGGTWDGILQLLSQCRSSRNSPTPSARDVATEAALKRALVNLLPADLSLYTTCFNATCIRQPVRLARNVAAHEISVGLVLAVGRAEMDSAQANGSPPKANWTAILQMWKAVTGRTDFGEDGLASTQLSTVFLNTPIPDDDKTS